MNISFKKIFFLIIFLISFYNRNLLFAREVEKVALMKFRTFQVTEGVTYDTREKIIDYLFSREGFEFRDIEFITRRIMGRGTRISTEQLIKIGRLSRVDTIISGTLKRNRDFKISLEFIDATSGIPLYRGKRTVEGDKDLGPAAISIIKDYETKFVNPTREGYYLRGCILPGWGQVYTRQRVKGGIIMSAFFLSSAYAAYLSYDFYNKDKDYRAVPMGVEYDIEAEKKFNISNKAYRKRNVALGLVAFIYLGNILNIVFFPPPFEDNISNGDYINPGISLLNHQRGDIYLDMNSDSGVSLFKEHQFSARLGFRWHF